MKKATLPLMLTCVFCLCSSTFLGQSVIRSDKSSTPDRMTLTLPFVEGWDLWNFDTNGWTTETANWVMNNQSGNPGPTAEFAWDPQLQNNYNSALISSPIDASLLTEGDIFLDFDIQLNNRHATGLEMMQVEVYDDSIWNTVATFSNTESFTWQSHHIKITPFAIQNTFKIRFKAVGENSFDILSWFIDNIEVYRTCPSVSNIYAVEYNYEDFLVTWDAPFPQPIAEWLYYDDGVNIDGIGGPDTIMWAIKFDPGQLEELEGASLTKIRIYNRTNATDELRIYEGPNAETLRYSQPLDNLPMEAWVTVELTEPVLIDVSKQFWIAVYSTDGANYPAACGSAMGEPNGDLITLDGINWEHLTDYNLMNTWNLRGFVTDIRGVVTELKQKTTESGFGTGSKANLSLSGNGTGLNNVLVDNASSDRSIIGFNVYRSVDNLTDFELLSFVPAIDSNVMCSYLDTDISIYMGMVCYQVTCIWDGPTDYCESAPGLNFMGDDDMICVITFEDVIQNHPEHTKVFPNPATNQFTVTSPEGLTQISLLNVSGQVIFQKNPLSEKSVSVDVTDLPSGIYFVKVSTLEGITTQKLVLNKQ